MATLKSIRKRITSVRNTQKITRAMKMVAAAKLRRAQSALTQARPYALLLEDSIRRLVTQADLWGHPLFTKVEEAKKAQILIITSDRGFCGGFNANLLRKVEYFTRHEGKSYTEIQISPIGRKGYDYYRNKNVPIKQTSQFTIENFDFSQALQLVHQYSQEFQAHQFDVLYLAYNSFKNVISQVPSIVQILPIPLEQPSISLEPPIFWEGSPLTLIEELLPRYLATHFFLGILESRAGELGSRMSAMENATNNAKEMIFNLTLQYNRARQAAITKELMDIVNGAEVLK